MDNQLAEGANSVPPRPTGDHSDVTSKAAQTISPQVQLWLKDAPEPTAADLNRLGEVLCDLLENFTSYDGYQLAKYLDDEYGWDVDAELVRILQEATAQAMFSALKQAEKQWIKSHMIQPKLTTNQWLLIQARRIAPKTHTAGMVIAKITEINYETGYYILYCPEMGNVEPCIGQSGHTKTYLAWEVAEKEGQLAQVMPATSKDNNIEDLLRGKSGRVLVLARFARRDNEDGDAPDWSEPRIVTLAIERRQKSLPRARRRGEFAGDILTMNVEDFTWAEYVAVDQGEGEHVNEWLAEEYRMEILVVFDSE